MRTTAPATYDGHVLRPDTPLNLPPDTRCLVTIETCPPDAEERDAWDALETLAGTVEAPADWSLQHDHYLAGGPKRHGGA